MKWVALALILLATPVLIAWLRTSPRQAPFIWSLLTFLPFVLDSGHLIIAPYSTPQWAGYVKGWEISLLDAVAVGVLFGTKGRWPKLRLVLPFLAYILAVAIAVEQARFRYSAFSYVFQLMRVFLVFLAIARVASDERGERALLTGLIFGLALQAGFAISARAAGAFQAGGTLGHQNLLGFVSHMALLPTLGLLLSNRWQKRALLGLVAGIIAVVLTASRATILIGLAGLASTMIISLLVRFSARKVIIAMAGFVLVAVSVPFAISALERRAQQDSLGLLEKDEQRVAFEKAAELILEENPFGIGPNHYAFVSNTEGYANRAGVNWSIGNRTAQVHNVYLLVAAETGYFGIVALLWLIIAAMLTAFSTAVKFRRSAESSVLLGLGVGLVAIVIHGFYEWVLVTYTAQYVFAGTLGLIVGLRSRLLTQSSKRKLDSSTKALSN